MLQHLGQHTGFYGKFLGTELSDIELTALKTLLFLVILLT